MKIDISKKLIKTWDTCSSAICNEYMWYTFEIFINFEEIVCTWLASQKVIMVPHYAACSEKVCPCLHISEQVVPVGHYSIVLQKNLSFQVSLSSTRFWQGQWSQICQRFPYSIRPQIQVAKKPANAKSNYIDFWLYICQTLSCYCNLW